MKLPDSSIGISDLVGYLECPQRMEFGMRRHTDKAPQESWSPANSYGSAIHLGIHVLDETGDVEIAVTTAFREFKQWLDPDGLQLLRDDLDTYLLREPLGYRTVFSEGEIKVPLFVHPTAGQIYFRARIDRLYVREDDDTSFLMVDYKSSRWPKSEDEVMKDLQGWAYQWGVREYMPEIETLTHRYDQLRFGMIETSKNAEQLERIKAWLIEAATALIEDDEMAPTFNQWCPQCPLRMDCSEIREGLTAFALARIAVLAPREPKIKKDGTPGKVLGSPTLDPDRFAEYLEVLPKVDKAKTTLEAFSTTVKATVKEMESERREEFGYRLREKKSRGISPSGLRAIHEELGDDFFQIAELSRASAERFYGKGADELTIIDKYLEERQPSYEVVAL